MNWRSELNGITPARGNATAMLAGPSPALPADTSSAASVGSPVSTGWPSLTSSAASLQPAPASRHQRSAASAARSAACPVASVMAPPGR
jgi:hypothetical protein